MNSGFLWLVLAGLVSGIFGGMGMGGGTLLIPILTILLGFAQRNAQAINLLVFIPMAIVSLIIHIKNKLVDFKVGIPVMISGTIFSVGGSIITNLIGNDIMRKIFGIFLLIVGIYQGFQAILMFKAKGKGCEPDYKVKVYFKY